MIETHELVIGHNGSAVLEPVNVRFEPGEFVAIVGANGVGKTTLLQTLAGLLPPISGGVHLNEQNLTRLAAAERARLLAFVDSETPVFGRMRVREVVATARMPYRAWWQWSPAPYDEQAVDDALAHCALQAFAEREFARLSSGEKQRVWIAAAFAQMTGHILLDEPTSRLDIRYAVDVLRLLRAAAARGAVVVASMHDLERAALFADRIIVLGERCILADAEPALALEENILHAAYGIAIQVGTTANRLWLLPRIEE